MGLLFVILALFVAAPELAQARKAKPAGTFATGVWVATWQASPEPPRSPQILLSGQTIRQVARVSLGGLYVRVRLSNEFGDKPLRVGSARVALAADSGAQTRLGTDRVLTFSGAPQIAIPAGARVLSDPVHLTVPSLSRLAVSLYFPDPVGDVTEHEFGMQTSWLASGDVTAATDMPGATTMNRQAILTGVDVSAGPGTKAVVALGDSLTGGFGSTMDANRRWPDLLAERVTGARGLPTLSVVNAGIGGNRLLHDSFGPNGLSRFDRDVLAQPGVGYLIVLLGINDLGFPGAHDHPDEEVAAADLIAGYRQLIARANSYGIKVFLGTMPPFGPIPDRPGYYSDAAEAKREAINRWIRTNHEAQGYVDFEAALRDPHAPHRILPAYDSGDHLDPNDAGYKAMADAVEFRLFK